MGRKTRNDILDYDNLILQLLDYSKIASEDNGKFTFDSEEIKLICKIADIAENSTLYKTIVNESKPNPYIDKDIEELYTIMHKGLVEAPTVIHLRCATMLTIPVIRKRLKERGLCN